MYKALCVKENPFNVNPDRDNLFLTKQIEEALSGPDCTEYRRAKIHYADRRSRNRKDELVNGCWLAALEADEKRHFLFISRMNSSSSSISFSRNSTSV